MKKINNIINILTYVTSAILFCQVSILGLPVISEISLIGGGRGIALVISADSPFDAEFSTTSKNVTAVLKNCIYGLSEFKYSDFPSISPLISISTIEKKNNSVEINLRLKSNVKIPLKAVKKENRWLVLLSDVPTTSFKWSSSEQLSNKMSNVENKSSKLENSEKKEDISISSYEREIKTTMLEDIYFIQRASICEISFIFSREVNAELKREKNIVIIRIKNAENGLENSVIKIPELQTFGDIYIKKDAEDLVLSITVCYDMSKKELGLLILNNNVISLVVKNPDKEKIFVWQNKKGVKINYSFIDVPVYSLDLIAMGKRAKVDSNTKISKDKVFVVALPENIDKRESILPESNTSTISKIDREQKDENSLLLKQKRQMKVVARSVNVRAKPSIDAMVISKLKYGDLVYVALEEGKWCKIERDNKKGYVYSSFLKEYEEKKEAIVSNSEEIKSIRKVSAITESPNIFSDTTSSVVVIKDEKDSTNTNINKVIRYNGHGRDPFVPILSSELSVNGLPFVENLVLVGILYDDNDRIALCEDQHNNSKPFSLRENDPVVKGKVLKIYKDKVVFLITEYGISRSYTLRLVDESNPKEVSKR